MKNPVPKRLVGANAIITASAQFGELEPSGALSTIIFPTLFCENVGCDNSTTNFLYSGEEDEIDIISSGSQG